MEEVKLNIPTGYKLTEFATGVDEERANFLPVYDDEGVPLSQLFGELVRIRDGKAYRFTFYPRADLWVEDANFAIEEAVKAFESEPSSKPN